MDTYEFSVQQVSIIPVRIQSYTCLTNHTSLIRGHIEVVKLLLKKEADIKIASNDGLTPLYSASLNGHLEVVRLLLDNGADATIAQDNGWTPVNAASESKQSSRYEYWNETYANFTFTLGGHIDIVKLLLDSGIDITTANNDGWTPLNTASDSKLRSQHEY